MPKTVSSFWLLLRRMLFLRKESRLSLERTYSLGLGPFADLFDNDPIEDEIHFDFTSFWSDDVLNDGEEIPEHLQMIVHDNPDDDIYYAQFIAQPENYTLLENVKENIHTVNISNEEFLEWIFYENNEKSL